jgi:hypothetical protein
MTPRERRLQRLEHAQRWRNLAAAGAPYSLGAHDLLDEARRYFALSLAEQLDELDTLSGAFSGEELDTMRAILIHKFRPLE